MIIDDVIGLIKITESYIPAIATGLGGLALGAGAGTALSTYLTNQDRVKTSLVSDLNRNQKNLEAALYGAGTGAGAALGLAMMSKGLFKPRQKNIEEGVLLPATLGLAGIGAGALAGSALHDSVYQLEKQNTTASRELSNYNSNIDSAIKGGLIGAGSIFGLGALNRLADQRSSLRKNEKYKVPNS